MDFMFVFLVSLELYSPDLVSPISVSTIHVVSLTSVDVILFCHSTHEPSFISPSSLGSEPQGIAFYLLSFFLGLSSSSKSCSRACLVFHAGADIH